MPANHYIDNKRQLIITTWEGEAHDNELIEAIKKYQKDIQNQPDCINYNELVDFSNVTNMKLTVEEIINIGEVSLITDKEEVHRKQAFVVSSNLVFGLGRMYQAYRSFSDKACKEIRIFKNENDALEWLEK